MSDPAILAVDGLSVSFPGLRDERTQVLDGVSFDVRRPETVALVGESGSGKSVSALSIMGLLPESARIDGGRIETRGRAAMIFQSPRASLNPLVKAGDQIARVVRLRAGESAKRARAEAVELMDAVGIDDPERRYHAYPHQLSGGMAQRVMIAMALAPEPELLIADEPTTGLDVTIQQQIFDVLLELQERLRMSVLLITHDLALVAETCDRVVVMHGGHVVEVGPVEAIYEEPAHPYTRRLLGSVLRVDRRVEVGERLAPRADGGIVYTSEGCRYSAKCEHVFGPCLGVRPELLPVGSAPGHFALCHLYDARFARERGRAAAS
jgi:oligopeptide/dipeptide ABC transporter ATP-binding protein